MATITNTFTKDSITIINTFDVAARGPVGPTGPNGGTSLSGITGFGANVAQALSLPVGTTGSVQLYGSPLSSGLATGINITGEPQFKFSGPSLNVFNLKNTSTAVESYSAISFTDPGNGIDEKAAIGFGKSNSALYPWDSTYFESYEGNGANGIVPPLRLVQTKVSGGYAPRRRIEIDSSGLNLGPVNFYSGTGPSYPNETKTISFENDGDFTAYATNSTLKKASPSGSFSLWGSNSYTSGAYLSVIGSTFATPSRQGGVEIYSDYNGGGGRISFGSHSNGAGFREVGFFAKTTGDFNVVAGKIVNPTMPTFSNDAAADAALASGTLYKLTGSRQVFQRP